MDEFTVCCVSKKLKRCLFLMLFLCKSELDLSTEVNTDKLTAVCVRGFFLVQKKLRCDRTIQGCLQTLNNRPSRALVDSTRLSFLVALDSVDPDLAFLFIPSFACTHCRFPRNSNPLLREAEAWFR